jgi:hypothetical protein
LQRPVHQRCIALRKRVHDRGVETMSRCPILAATALALVVGCDQGQPSGTGAASAAATATAAPAIPQLTDTMPSSVSAKRAEANTAEDPKANFFELAEVVKASAVAPDKTVLIRGHVSRLLHPEGWSYVHECVFKRSRITLEVQYPPEKAALMRALPTHKPNSPCPRIHVQITGFGKETGNPQGKILEVYDVQPDPVPGNLPKGIDFISLQDVMMRGPSAVGGVADFPVFFDHKEEKGGVTYYALQGRDCAPHGSWEGHLWVASNDKNRSTLDAIPKRPKCQRVRAKITSAPPAGQPERWGAEIQGIGKPLSVPEPPPSP